MTYNLNKVKQQIFGIINLSNFYFPGSDLTSKAKLKPNICLRFS